MGSVARSVSKPLEWVGHAASNAISSIGGLLTPKMPDRPTMTSTPPAEPAGPGASASESSDAQAERLRVLSAARRKKTQTLLTGAQRLTGGAGVARKILLGE